MQRYKNRAKQTNINDYNSVTIQLFTPKLHTGARPQSEKCKLGPGPSVQIGAWPQRALLTVKVVDFSFISDEKDGE